MKTDSQLQQDVLAELKWDPSIVAPQIGVEVKDGIVTLVGEVSSYSEKWSAERAAQRVAGVAGLVIKLEVELSQFGKRTDADIARSAENVLGWTVNLPKDCVKVMVEDGWITLTGNVDWQFQKEAATTALRDLAGVCGVSDEIGIKPKLSSTVVKSDIEAALKRRAQSDTQKITVEVNGSGVTLSGTVHSWSERELARESAWGSPGVRSVLDKITIAY